MAEDVLAFWFQGDTDLYREARWFTADPAFDDVIRQRFGFIHRAALDGALDGWAESPDGALALVIVLDQFSRHIHRGSYLAFAGDPHARRIARTTIERGADAMLTSLQRGFLYLPFEHSEHMADQDLSVRLFATLTGDFSATMRDYAERHGDVIRRFGRFPQRNAALGRASTPAEIAYLNEAGSLS
ncbi:MAG TPA: DUF924 family protein [Acetobacteraceae bacterium]|jgi:uncharacterized protein (DUF924 family)